MDAWLSALRSLPYDQQVKGMIGEGRAAAAGDQAAVGRLDALWAGDAWMRQMAVTACFTSGDGERVLAATQDASGRVRSLSYRVAPFACGDGQVVEALKRGREVRRDKGMALVLYRKDRRAALDAYIDWLAVQRQRRDFADFLPLGTPEVIARHWALAAAQPSAAFWARMATCAPAPLAERLAARVRTRDGEPDPVDRRLIETYQAVMAERAPAQTMDLVQALLARGIEPQPKTWKRLARALPQEAMAALREHPRLRAAGLLAQAPVGDGAFVREAVELEPALLGDADTLRQRLPKALRAEVAAAWAARCALSPLWGVPFLQDLEGQALQDAAAAWSFAARDGEGVISLYTLQALPRELRAQEARRHMQEVVALGTRPMQRVPYARFLPWEEAREALAMWLGHPEGELRGLTLSVLLVIPGFYPERPELATQAMELVLQRKFEQDPVRAIMFEALAQWPRTMWRADLLPAVARALRDGLDASDLSHRTAAAAEALVVRLFGVDPAWGAVWLATLIKERGQLQRYRLGDQLTDDEVRAAGPHLLAIAKTWRRSERNEPLIQLSQSLGARLPLVEGLSALLAQCALASPWWWEVASITQLLWRHDRGEGEGLVEALLRSRRTPEVVLQLGAIIASPLVPDLEAALREVALGGGRTEHILQALTLLRAKAISAFNDILPALLRSDRSFVCVSTVHSYIHRRRQDLLDFCLDEAPVTGRFATGNTAWVLPFSTGFWRWTPEQNARYEATLQKVLLDPERDTPTALVMVARLANLFSVRGEALCDAAQRHPHPAMKEKAIRVLARLDEGQGMPTLLDCLGDERARFAIYGLRRALLALPASRALGILMSAPLHKVTVAKEVLRLLGDLRTEAAYDALLAFDAREDLHRDVRIALLRALWDHLDRDETWAVFERAASGPDMIMASRVGDIPADRLTADSDRRLSALLARVLDRPEPEARIDLLSRAHSLSARDIDRVFWRACIRRLRSPFDDEVRAAMMALLWRSFETDLKALEGDLRALREDRRALSMALNALLSQNVRSRALWKGVAAAAERALRDDPHMVALLIRCAAAHHTPSAYAAFLVALSKAEGGLSHDATVAALGTFAALPGAALEGFTLTLLKSPYADARRLALGALLLDAAPGRGWTPERIAQLKLLQQDPSPKVAGPAQAVFPPRELL
jgi:hypothetical protein